MNSKIEYLKSRGWNVIVFGPKEKCTLDTFPWENMYEYKDNCREELGQAPEFWSRKRRKKVLDWMKEIIGQISGKCIIESHTDFFSEWGELLGRELNAKNFCFLLDERLNLYGAKEFLYYKYLRGEVAGIHETSMKLLFENYKDVAINDRFVLSAVHGNNVQNVHCDLLENLGEYDWIIGYLGRNKQYVKNIKNGVLIFAERYPNKKILFLPLGDVGDCNKLEEKSNIEVKKLGYMNPMPREFFEVTDVIIAGSGCASISARENVPTIVAQAQNCLASGILGYTVFDSLFADVACTTFEEQLKLVLVDDICRKMPYKLKGKASLDEAFDKHFQFIEKSKSTMEYFDFTCHPQKNYSTKNRLKYFVIKYIHDIVIGDRKHE